MNKILAALGLSVMMGLSMAAQANESFVDVGGFNAMLTDSNSGGAMAGAE